MLREYAWERLVEAGEAEDTARRHAEHFHRLATAADAGLRGADEEEWTVRVEQDLDNLRGAVGWAVDADRADLALGIVAALAPGFANRIGAPFGPLAERAAATPGADGHPLRSVALASAARSASDRGHPEHALELANAALAEAARLPSDEQGAWARCRAASGVSAVLGAWDPPRVDELAELRLAAADALGDPFERSRALTVIAGHSVGAAGRPAGEEAVRLARQVGNPTQLGFALMMAAPTIAPTDPDRAAAMLEEAIDIAEVTKNSFARVNAHQMLAFAHRVRGDPRAAAHAHLDGARLALRRGDRGYVCMSLAGVACLLADAGELEGALLLAARAAREAGWPDDWTTIPGFPSSSEALVRARDALTPRAREQLVQDASSLDDNDALALAATCLQRLGGADKVC
jgi:hypothetical protein